VALTLKYPASVNYIFSIKLSSGAIVIRQPLVFTTLADLLTKVSRRDGVAVAVADTSAVVVGTFSMSSVDGQLDDTDSVRNIINIYNALNHYALAKGPAFALTGGYMPTADKQAATWTWTGGGGWTNTANAYDGSDANYATMAVMTTNGYAKVDFGGPVVLERITIRTGGAGNIINNCKIYGSDTGVFGGEEETLATFTSFVINTTNEINFARRRYRYWRIEMWHSATGSAGYIYEIGFYLSSTLAFSGIPYGCEVRLYDNTDTLIEAQRNTGYKFYEFIDFASASADTAVKCIITRPDGTSPWLHFAITPTLGDVYSLIRDQDGSMTLF
jgi:hypothetical protein